MTQYVLIIAEKKKKRGGNNEEREEIPIEIDYKDTQSDSELIIAKVRSTRNVSRGATTLNQ